MHPSPCMTSGGWFVITGGCSSSMVATAIAVTIARSAYGRGRLFADIDREKFLLG